MNWPKEAAMSHYKTAVAIRQQLAAGNVIDADAGMKELIDALARSERRALKSQLTRLMVHVLKWQTQPNLRCPNWTATIRSARDEIKEIQEEAPSLTDDVIRGLWDRSFESALDQAEAEMGQPASVSALSWDEVFNAQYRV